MKLISKASFGYLIAGLVGGFFAFIVAGQNILDVTNIAWLQSGDPDTHNLGWVFYRFDVWRFPLGLNPHYGLGIGSSIVYSDSIPLAAMFFKAFQWMLPKQFQYLGLWTYLCFILQALISWALMRLITKQRLLCLLGMALLTFSPAMLWRVGEHAALVSHFLVLGALYLNLAKIDCVSKKYLWILCLSTATLTQFYILAMVTALWVADVFDEIKLKKISFWQGFRNLLIGFLAIGFLAWIAGYFSVGVGTTIATGNYGVGKLNLLSLVNSGGWSYFLPAITYKPASDDLPNTILAFQEGYNYLGLGVIVCLCISLSRWALIKSFAKSFYHHHPFLLFTLLILALFSISNIVSIGPWSLEIPMPKAVISFASILRASARMFWPVYYLIVFAIFYVVIRGFPRGIAISILFIGIAIQISDTSAGWFPLREKLMKAKTSKWSTTLKHPFWGDASTRFENIFDVPLRQVQAQAHWESLAAYAATNRMGTNAVYLARYDRAKLKQENTVFDNEIASGSYKKNSIYIVDDEKIIPVLSTLNKNKDAFVRIDGLNVLVPNWLSCADCPQFKLNDFINRKIPKIDLNKPIFFDKDSDAGNLLVGVGQREVLGWGWSYPELWGTWIDGGMGRVVLPIPKSGASSLDMNLRVFTFNNMHQKTYDLWVNDEFIKSIEITSPQDFQLRIDLDKLFIKKNYLVIDFRKLDPVRPKDLGMGDDGRLLSIGLISATFH